jgi:hypothetical protein
MQASAFTGPSDAVYWLLILTPALPYVVLNLSYRRILGRKIAEVESRLSRDIRALYAQAYGDPDIRKSLEQFYHWTTYVAPVGLTMLVAAAFAAVGVAVAGLPLPGLPESLLKAMRATSPIVLAGAAGAYLWGIDDCVKRHGSADMSSNALHATWVRIALAAGFGAVLAGMGTPSAAGIPVAFALATLPLTEMMWSFMRRRFQVDAENGKAWEADLHLIEGLTVNAKNRLLAEEIDSCQRLAFTDPVRLLFRTNIEWNVILDSVDQAMLANYVGEKIAGLRALGIRGAIELAELTSRKPENGDSPAAIGNAQRVLGLVGAVLGQGRDAAYNLSFVLNNDPQVDFIWKNWGTVFGSEPVQPRAGRQGILQWIGRLTGRTPPPGIPGGVDGNGR